MLPENSAKLAGMMKGTIMGVKAKPIRDRLLVATAIGAMMMVAAPARADDGRRQEYDIEGQSLGEALKSVSRQSGREIIFSAEAVSGKQAPRLHGHYLADDAVRALLAESGLTAEFRKDVVIIRGRSEPSSEIDDRSTGASDIVVTGSHIRGAPSASPTTVATREQIENSGQTDLGGFVRTLPQNFSGGQNPGVAGGGAQGAINQNTNASSTLNLRGLGPDATLTLINGHRVAYDGIFQGVDIASIPLFALDRIEIVADGSSALYGSDAVGGVANVILRQDFDGLVTSARFGASTDGGNAQQQYDAVGGAKWSSGGFLIGSDYTKVSAIDARDRSYTQSLDGSQTLVPAQKQVSVILAGHQDLSSVIGIKIDAQFSDRHSENGYAYLTTTDVFTNGLWAKPDVLTYTITPSLEFRLPGSWRATLLGSYGRSKTNILSRFFNAGAEYQRTRLLYDNDLALVEANAEGPLFALAGGDVRLAVGGGYRSNGLDVDIRATPSGGTTSTTDKFSANRDVAYGFGELSIPLVGQANRFALAYKLNLSAAFRYESYRGGESVTTPKVGLTYAPVPDITIKATWGRSFKAQTLYQQYQLRDVSLINGGILTNFPPGRTFIYLSGGGLDLRPERARTWTASVELHPRWLSGLTAQISYFNVRYRDRVAAPITSIASAVSDPSNQDLIAFNPTESQLAEVIASASQGLRNLTGAPYSPSSVYAIINNRLQNTARQSLQGMDIAIDYRISFSENEKLNISGSASYIQSDQQVASTKPITDLAGTNFNPPHWRGRIGGTYEKSNVTVSGFINYIGSVEDVRRHPFYHVGSFVSFDATARIRSTASHGIFHGLEFSVSALNLFNEKPDRLRNTNPIDPTYDSTNYPVAGRVLSLALTKAW